MQNKEIKAKLNKAFKELRSRGYFARQAMTVRWAITFGLKMAVRWAMALSLATITK